MLPPYTELVRFDAGPRLAGEELRAAAAALLREHLAAAPADEPVRALRRALADDLPGLLEGDAADYHAYAFATVRMVGSAFEISASHVDWLLGADGAEATEALTRIVDGCKVLSLKLARRRPFDPEPLIADLAAAWEDAMTSLDAAVD